MTSDIEIQRHTLLKHILNPSKICNFVYSPSLAGVYTSTRRTKCLSRALMMSLMAVTALSKLYLIHTLLPRSMNLEALALNEPTSHIVEY